MTVLDIKRITLREIHLRLREPFRISSGVVQDRRIMLIEIEEKSGAVGWGECVAGEFPNYTPETIDTAWFACTQWLIPRLFAAGPIQPEAVLGLFDADIRGHNMAKAGLEMAIWALAAEQDGVALARLLGGTRSKVATGISIGIQRSPQALAEKAQQARAEGYRKIKCKIKPGTDLVFLEAVRHSAGEEIGIMADANSAYTLENIAQLQALDDLGLMMIEQPLAWDDLREHAELQKQLRTPICLDESITCPERARDMHMMGSGRIINIKPGRVGGLYASLQIHNYCREHGIPVWCGGMLESGIGRAHNVALASLPNFTLPGDISPSARYWAEDIVEPEWTMENGFVAVPNDIPGLGVKVRRSLVEKLTHRAEEFLR